MFDRSTANHLPTGESEMDMAAYVIADVDVTDPDLFAEYRKLVLPIVEMYGGRYIVRGGESQVIEGDWTPHRTVVIQFDSVERAREWYDSPEYTPVKDMRFRSANTSVLIVDGA